MLIQSLHSLAYRAGVTSGITAPSHRGFLGGLSASFSTGVLHKLKNGAVIQAVNALHVSVGHFGKTPSVSTQIAALRRLLLYPDESYESDTGRYFREVRAVCTFTYSRALALIALQRNRGN